MTIKFNIPDNNTKQKLSGMKTLTGDSSPQQPPQGVVASTVRATPHTHSSVDPGLRKMAQVMSGGGVTQANPMFFSPLHTPQNWQIAAKRREIYQWARFWYENEPKVAAGIDFLSQFPINGFKLECKSKKVLKYFEKVVKRLRIETIATMISFERNLLGDVFPFKEIECAHCGGSGYLPNGQPCSHPGGNIKRVIILNPESIDVRRNPLASEPVISLVPDEELRATISNPQNKPLIEKMDQKFIAQVLSGIPIQLSNRCVSHIKFNEKDYATYGMTMLRRLFMMLAYKQKLMTANWIVSERLILPVRLVKVGDSDRPAREEDLATVSAQFAQVANDPNLTLVTHHAIDYDWHGACYSDDTEILTENGWKLFKDLLPSEKVATYNQNNNNLEFELPLEYHEYDFKSHPYMQMIGFKNKSMDILVTPNHRMLIERKGELQEVYSQDVKHGDRMLSSSEWSGVTPKNLPYKESPIGHLELDDYLKFVGYYLSEGGLQIERRGKNKTKRIASCHITQNEKSECFNDIKDIVEKVYKKYTDHFDDRKNDTCHQFTINSVEIARYVAKEFGEGSASKSIPNWIKNLPVEKLEILFNALMAGDGDSRKSKNTSRHRYTTVSKNLADDVSEICIKLGYTTRTAIEKSTNVNRKDIYRTYFSDYRKETKFYIKKKYISRHDYDGKVYCVKVPNSWVYVRRNGKVAICGNTGKIHNISQEMEIIGKEILDGLMLNQSLLNGEGPSYGCYDEKTRVLTNNGLKYIYEVDENDLIACYDKDSGKLSYSKPLEKHEYDFDGSLIRFRTNNIDMLVTPNHKMHYSPRDSNEWLVGEASDVKDRASFKKTVVWDNTHIQNVPENLIKNYLISDILKLYGYYATEGSLQRETRKNRSTYGDAMSIKISQTAKGKGWGDMQSLLSDNNFNLKYREALELDRNGNEYINSAFYIHNKKLAQFIEEECGSHSSNKKLPLWIKNLPKEHLKELLMYMINGDGTRRQAKKDKSGGKEYFEFITISEQLRDDVIELALKCGYAPKFTKHDGVNYDIYRVKFSDFDLEKDYYNLESKKYQTITEEEYKGKVWCFTTETGFFITERNGKFAIQGNSAQVGIEAMAQRLESWRRELKDWIENEIFLPISMMQGFVDEEQTKEMRELLGDNTITEWLCPTIKWNDMNLRDDSNQRQLDIQLFDKKLISARRLLQGFDIDYDQMIEEIREESVITGALGQMMPGGMGGGGMGGAMGGMGGDLGGGMMGMGGIGGGGPDMGIPDAGGMGGDLGGGMGGDMGGGMGAAAGSVPPGFKVGKGGSGKKEEPQQMAPMQKTVPLTSLEIKVANSLNSLEIPYQAFLQYEVMVPGQSRPFLIDFAYPQIGVGIEADGDKWHAAADLKAKDAERDQKLANIGWRILRFNENAINEHMDLVQKVIYDNVLDAANQRKKKKADNDEAFIKLAQSTNNFKNLKEIDDKNLKFKIEPVTYNGVNIGDCLYIGV